VRNLTETIKSTLLDRELPYFRNASGKAIPMMTFGSGDGGRSVDIPDGAACIIVYTCPVDENYCGVEYHGINGIIDSEDARNLEAQFMLEEAGPLACTHKGASFFEISNIADDDVLNMRVDADPQSQKIGAIPPDATCITNHGCIDGWCRVEYDHRIGWVDSLYLAEYLTHSHDFCVAKQQGRLQADMP
jgi:hypothetical protein